MSLIRERRCPPEDQDVLQVLGLLLVHLPEHPFGQDLGEPEDRVQRRPELVGHVGEELGLVRLATSSCRLLSAISRDGRAFWMARADWVAKVWSSSMTSGANAPGVSC